MTDLLSETATFNAVSAFCVLIMSDEELDQILNEIKKRANASTPIDSSASAIQEEKIKPEPKQDPQLEERIESFKLKTAPEEEIKLIFEPEKADVEEAVNDFSHNAEKEKADMPMLDISNLSETADEYDEIDDIDEDKPKKSKKILITVISVIVIIALAAGIYFGFFYKKDTEDKPTKPGDTTAAEVVEKDLGPLNPLTGETGYNSAAVGKRPVAVVVENEYSTESVRPQWGLSDADIVLEGESEYSTRLLLFWADYTTVPEQVGPTRSARPPFIHFSELFDSIFIHAGLSHSKNDYVGADTVFKEDNVDHVNLLSYSEDGTYFGRNYDRTSTVEHTGYLNGSNLTKLIEEKGFTTDVGDSSFTALAFNKEAQPLSDSAATAAEFNWSDVYSTGKCPKTGHFTYNSEGGYYTTTDFDSDYGTADLQFENLIFLLDETEYIVKENYKSSGNSETYCDYKLSGGEGKVLSEGTFIDITWGVDNGKLWLKDSNGNTVSLNPGKSYIGYGSSNHGGSITINPDTTNQ
ncbi:MAG: DUF3048 domain-containing protein [Eubacterium sp.]